MKSYSPTESPEFTDSITVCEETDEGHADNINAAPKQLLQNTIWLKNELACNLLYIEDFSNGNSTGGTHCYNGNYGCYIPSENVTVWSGEIALPEGGYAYPASSDTADVIVAYTLDGEECQVEISGGAVLPEGAVVTEYRLERKEGESRIVANIWPMISPGKRAVQEFVEYTGDERKMNRCIAFVLKTVEKLHKFCLEKFLPQENVVNNLVTTNAGYALDARQGKVLQDKITGINDNLSQLSACDLLATTSSADGAFVALSVVTKYRYLYFDCCGYDNLYADKFMPTHVILCEHFHHLFVRNTETGNQFMIAATGGSGITIYPTLVNSGSYVTTHLWGVSRI